MSFALYRPDHRKGVQQLINRLAQAERVTLVLGAGISMEVGLPDWSGLVDSALRAAALAILPDDAAAASEWRSAILQAETLPGALSVAKSSLGTTYDELLPRWVYGADTDVPKKPGPSAERVAELADIYGASLRIATTNYDLLVERALEAHGGIKDEVLSSCGAQDDRPGRIYVQHIHGYVNETGERYNAPVSTDADYQTVWDPDSWQSRYFAQALEESVCLFLGTSLLDQDVRAFLARAPKNSKLKPAVLFVYDEDRELSSKAREKFERQVQFRWEQQGISAAFLDFYGDVSTFLRELAHAREYVLCDEWPSYDSLFLRCENWIRIFEHDCLGVHAARSAFLLRQGILMQELSAILQIQVEEVSRSIPSVLHDVHALSLWVCSPDGKRMRRWIMSDRTQCDPATVDDFALRSSYLPPALRARRANDVVVVEYDAPSKTRWDVAVAVPINVTDGSGTLPIGALTLGVRRGVGSQFSTEDCQRLAGMCAEQLNEEIVTWW